jgi:DNA ligase-1
MVEFMLAKEFNCLKDKLPTGWYVSEKYDGYRARYMGESNKTFLSRQGKLFNSPEWFTKAMPDENLDGELWVGRDNFQEMGEVRRKNPEKDAWKNIKYIVYDLPDYPVCFRERLIRLKEVVSEAETRWKKTRVALGEPFTSFDFPIIVAEQIPLKNKSQLNSIYKSIINNGGEGVMFKNPNSDYEDKRSNNMLKYKPSFDEEAIIVDYKPGKGKYKSVLGCFVCKPLINMDTHHIIDNDENHEFSISGMDDDVRENYKKTHPIGSIISYQHSGKTKAGKPRFARYVRLRDDITLKDKVDSHSTEKRDRIVFIFKELASYERRNKQTHRSLAYLKIIPSIQKLSDDSMLTETNLREIKGVGDKILEKIVQIVTTGTCKMYDNIKDIVDPRKLFVDIHGVGPKKANDLMNLGFKTIQQLRECETIDQILNDKQMIGLKYYESLLERIPRDEIVKHERFLKHALSNIDESADLTIAGSYRRGKPDSGDMDILLKSSKKCTYEKLIKLLTDLGYLKEHLAYGDKKYNGICKLGRLGKSRRIDIMYTKPNEYPFAILYFTGSDSFNKEMRQKCLEKGLSLNEYSLKVNETKVPLSHAFYTEKDIFEYLGFPYVEPTKR